MLFLGTQLGVPRYGAWSGLRRGAAGEKVGGAVGFLKDAKANSLGQQAARAAGEGRQVFACRVNEGGWNDSWGGSLSGVAEQIEAVEAAGWVLDKASFLPGKGQNVSAFLIFRIRNGGVPVQGYRPS